MVICVDVRGIKERRVRLLDRVHGVAGSLQATSASKAFGIHGQGGFAGTREGLS